MQTIEGDHEVMRRVRFDPNARGIDCAAQRDNVIGAKGSADNIRANGRHDPDQQAEDMTAPAIQRTPQNNP
jgi:hypothetical protein